MDSIFNNNHSLQIYPNPNDGKFILILPNNVGFNYSIEIYNVFGVKVLSKKFEQGDLTNSQIIDVSGLNQGLYYCSIITKRGRIVEKFAVVR